MVRSTRVFISYAWESDEHIELVRNLYLALRQNGIDAQLDRVAAATRQDWALWMAQQIRDADHVLVIASAAYRRRAEGRATSAEGRGVQWEARLIRDTFYRDQHALDRFVPVVLPGHTEADLPDFLAPSSSTVYHVADFSPAGLDPLLRFLTRQPEEVEPPLGPAPLLKPRQHDLAPVPPPPAPAPTVRNTVSGTVSGLVIQANDIHGNIHISGGRVAGGRPAPVEPRRLEVSVDSLHSLGDSWFHAFRSEDAAVAERLSRRGELPSDPAEMDALFAEQLRAGAYMLARNGNAACVMLALFNPGEHEALVRNVHVANRTTGPIVDGPAFWIERGGMNENPVTFRLDEHYPVARLIAEGRDEGPYFKTRHIKVLPGEQVALPLMFEAEQAAHTFTLTIEYYVSGRRLSQAVDNNGQPFRVSPIIYGRADLRYARLYAMTWVDGRPGLTEVSPDDFSEL